MAQVNAPDPNATAVPAPTGEPARTGEPTQAPVTHKPVPTTESVAPDSDLAEHVYSDYSQEVIDHPNRLLFGTDFLSAWHFEDAGNDVIIDFARRFIGLLPEELQEDFAYKNGLYALRKHLD
ncbi:MAG: hypothetical protein QGI76_08300 [Dehalococcoidia bacterium]|nr:hypothetical protein [Dehalococcoidia bacterium]